MRNNKLFIVLILAVSCSKADEYDLFKIKGYKESEITSIEVLKDIRQFNKSFWKLDSIENGSRLVFGYSFNEGKFDDGSTRGIRLSGFPFPCLGDLHCGDSRNSSVLILNSERQVLNGDFEQLDSNEIETLFIKNLLNNGQDPTLSDNSQEAEVLIYIDSLADIRETDFLIKILADRYIKLLKEKEMETGLTLNKLKNEFCLNISLREGFYLPNRMPVIDENDIE